MSTARRGDVACKVFVGYVRDKSKGRRERKRGRWRGRESFCASEFRISWRLSRLWRRAESEREGSFDMLGAR
jgi:hypothetical protein